MNLILETLKYRLINEEDIIINQFFNGMCGGQAHKDKGFEFAYCAGKSAGCSKQGKVWGPTAEQGTKYYCEDSSLCSAALHQGVIGESGGLFLVMHGGSRGPYTGCEKNGKTSLPYGQKYNSFCMCSLAINLEPKMFR